jgi:hypothetical protein
LAILAARLVLARFVVFGMGFEKYSFFMYYKAPSQSMLAIFW